MVTRTHGQGQKLNGVVLGVLAISIQQTDNGDTSFNEHLSRLLDFYRVVTAHRNTYTGSYGALLRGVIDGSAGQPRPLSKLLSRFVPLRRPWLPPRQARG